MDAVPQLALYLPTPQAQGSGLAIHKTPSALLFTPRHSQTTFPPLAPQTTNDRGATHLFTSTKHHALTLLRNLTKHTMASFEAAKYTQWHPFRPRGLCRALHIINKALQYPNLTPPKPNIPLTVPFLAHPDFTKHCQQWLQTTIQQHKHLATPLHLPTHRLREAAHKTLRAQLHNHRAWEDTLHTPPDPCDLPCACSHLRTLLLEPSTPTINDHYILTLDQLALPAHLLDANMISTFYPSKARYFLTFQTAFTKWLRLQGLPTSLSQHLEPFLSTPMAPSHRTTKTTSTLYSSSYQTTSATPG